MNIPKLLTSLVFSLILKESNQQTWIIIKRKVGNFEGMK